MKNVINDFSLPTVSEMEEMCRSGNFGNEAVESLCRDYEAILSHPAAVNHLMDAASIYLNEGRLDFYNYQVKFESFGIVHIYAAQLLFYLALTPALKMLYQSKGLDEQMFRGILDGYACKVRECYDVYGIYGSFVAVWFSRFFNFTLFPIGRFEFAPISSPVDMEQFGIKKGDYLIDVHIPSRGRLDPNEAQTSYKEAIDFFDRYFNRKHKGFFLESWLIYPDNRKIIPGCSNIMAFMDDFYIYYHEESIEDMWRIFGSSSLSYPSSPLSDRTYMQKQFKAHFENGGTMGVGYGIRPI